MVQPAWLAATCPGLEGLQVHLGHRVAPPAARGSGHGRRNYLSRSGRGRVTHSHSCFTPLKLSPELWLLKINASGGQAPPRGHLPAGMGGY